MRRARDGFALITVLWVMVAASAVAVTARLAARHAINAATNRVDAERAFWRAVDCAERARAAADSALAGQRRDDAVPRTWRGLDEEILRSPLVHTSWCDLSVEAAGARLDLNAAEPGQLRRLFQSLDLQNPDALTDAVLDWRDADDEPRPNGAERDWYASASRREPRNAPIADVRELSRIAGFENVSGMERSFAVEPGRISINSAPAAVLASIPGFTEEVVSRVLYEREAGRQVGDVLALSALVSRASADSMMAHYPEIARLATADPDAWVVLARGHSGAPPLSVFVDVRFVLSDRRVAVTRRRSWQ